MTFKEVPAYIKKVHGLDFSERTIRGWRRRGILKVFASGTKVQIRPCDVDKALEKISEN